ncbi:MAG: hypothetical protein AAF597_19515 [Bacteroidota bacterium]
MTKQRISFWSSPRNISTALMYSFAQREDMAVVDEPLYAHYLRRQPTSAEHPGKATILASQENDGNLVIKEMLEGNFGKPKVLFKQMTHHLVALDEGFLDEMDNVLLIRNPRAILASFSKVVDGVTAEDIGLPQQLRLFRTLSEKGKAPAVVDARLLLQDPKAVLQRLCQFLNLSWTDKMLTWQAGPRPEDGVWAPYWYANVHKSTGFLPYREKHYDLPPALETIAAACQPIYASLLEAAI